jgi:hypothetical protein
MAPVGARHVILRVATIVLDGGGAGGGDDCFPAAATQGRTRKPAVSFVKDMKE